MTRLLQKIATEEIGNRIEKLVSEYLTEELRNPHRRTMKKISFERQSRELKSLFLLIDSRLS